MPDLCYLVITIWTNLAAFAIFGLEASSDSEFRMIITMTIVLFCVRLQVRLMNYLGRRRFFGIVFAGSLIVTIVTGLLTVDTDTLKEYMSISRYIPQRMDTLSVLERNLRVLNERSEEAERILRENMTKTTETTDMNLLNQDAIVPFKLTSTNVPTVPSSVKQQLALLWDKLENGSFPDPLRNVTSAKIRLANRIIRCSSTPATDHSSLDDTA